ncbi:MAG: 4Fe-4S dicluster domain-containing protein [Planctomycetes bacterium]|nr:4Fe-4S dicluster domain-containing protein [Planctomycetota bacterium]
MGYGFVIDQRRCIGCHACTVACKAENEVPLGDFRTWVKYTEKGSFPDVRRHFTVLRCNHCDAAPCVEICPVTALHKRPDAIVDLDRDQCIGCRACMQACPYDALYLNEERGTAEKCHYCAHRTEVGLEPACVIVCPEQAIVAGDVDDSGSRIAGLIRDEATSQRRLEKETKPRVWYLDVLPESIEPGCAAEPPQYLWADRAAPPPPVPGGFEMPQDLITTLDVHHKPAWGWHVWTYLLTKNVAAGAMIFAPVAALVGASAGAARDYLPELVALIFLGVTNVLLVHDLGRWERFWKILLQPNTRSWLVKGAWVLTAFGLLIGLSLVCRLVGADRMADVLRWIDLPVAVMASGYSAWLFGQCKGRDLWLEKGLFLQLVARAALFGAALGMLLPQVPAHGYHNPCGHAFVWLAVICAFGMVYERQRAVRGRAAQLAEAILRDSFRCQAAVSLMVLGAVSAQIGLLLGGLTWLRWICLILGLACATMGLFFYERSWIRAGQAVPNS